MKIGGITVTPPSEKFLVLEREGGDIIFRALAVPDFDEFEAQCPEPTAPKRMVKGSWEIDTDNKPYREAVAQYTERKLAYLAIRTLEPSEIEWETVDINKPSTWRNWREDLHKAGVTNVELNHLMNLVWEANALDEEKLKAARESFALGRQVVPSEPSSQNSEPQSS